MQIYHHSEVTDINKQKFLAELGKLLTFMYEEDRQAALAMYSVMFDEAEDVQQLVHLLMSPTRQAVIIARAYDANARKLQVTSQTRGEGEEASPDFLKVVEKVREDAIERGIIVPTVSEDQISLFENEPVPEFKNSEELRSYAAYKGPTGPDTPADIGAFEDSELEYDAPAAGVAPVESNTVESALPAVEEDAPDLEDIISEQHAEAAPVDAVDAFLADFNFEKSQEVDEAEAVKEMPAAAEDEVAVLEEIEEIEEYDNDEEDADEPRLKAKPLALIPYTILAVVLGMVGIAVLLIPTVACLGLAGVACGTGVLGITSLLHGFALFADILVVVGASLILLGVGLFFLWAFIWFIGGAMVGYIRGLIRLGRKWCYKEVPTNE